MQLESDILSDSFCLLPVITTLQIDSPSYNEVTLLLYGVDPMRPNQKEKMIEYLNAFYDRNGYPPSLSQVASAVGLETRANIGRQLMQLVAEGRLCKIDGKYYPPEAQQLAQVVMVPILGDIAAGVPIEAIENLDGYIGFLPQGHHISNKLFALRVRGESMIDAGIYDGDIVVVEQTSVADNGQIVAAMIDGEATVKRFYKEFGHYRLQPENPTMEPIIVDQVDILGRVVSSMRYYQ